MTYHRYFARMKNKVQVLTVLAVSLFMLNGCTLPGMAVGAGATVGVAAAQEGGLRKAATDTSIRLNINDLWFKHDVEMFRKVNLIVKEGRVLLTGIVQDPDHRVEAVRLAWLADGVTQVINEIQVRENYSWAQIGQDNWLGTRLRTSLTFDKHIQSINYSVSVVDGVVYLIGIGQDQTEVDLVIQHARNIPNVRQVVSYVRLRGDTPPNIQTPRSRIEEL